MTDFQSQENPESEGMKNLREAQARAADEAAALRQENALLKIGVSPTEKQITALNAVLGGDWSDPEAVGASYAELFGTPTTTPDPTPTPSDPTGEVVSEAPAPPAGAILGDVNDMTTGGSVAPGLEPEGDPVDQGFAAMRQDLQNGRRTEDAQAQVLNRLVDRGASGKPGGVYDQNEYHQRLLEGAPGPEVRIVE